MKENESSVDLELVDKVREFLMLRFSLVNTARKSDEVPFEHSWITELVDYDNALHKMQLDADVAYEFVMSRIDDFKNHKDYVLNLMNDDSTGPHEVLAFLDTFNPDYTSKN